MKDQVKQRIIFIDLMRAFAVLMMVQGHTIDAFLANEYRSGDSIAYYIWNIMRGFTAPIFMFSSGTVFTYLLRLNQHSFFENPRVKKGLIRFIMLVTIGYLLRFPSFAVFDFESTTHAQWMTFFTVDALHLIGFGLLFILVFTYIGEKLHVLDYIIYSLGAIIFFTAFFFTESTNWANFMPIPFAAYFYSGTGSLFPFFPWAGYVLSGAVLGSYLAKHSKVMNYKKFVFQILSVGIALLLVAGFLNLLIKYYYKADLFVPTNIFLIFQRLGFVVLLNGLMAFIAQYYKTIPSLIKKIGTQTLLIYAVHVVILYGSAWLPGFNLIFAKAFSPLFAITAAIIMISLMILMVAGLDKMKLPFTHKTK